MSKSGKKRVLIMDLGSSGHHPRYIRWLIEWASTESAEIIVASSEELFAHVEIKACAVPFTRHPISVGPKVQALMQDVGGLGLIRRNWAIGRLYRKTCQELARRAPIGLVIIPFLDVCVLGLAVPREAFGGIPWLTITMQTMFHQESMGVVTKRQRFSAMRRLFFSRLLKQNSLISVLTLDPTLAEFAERQGGIFSRKVAYLPDPAARHMELPSKETARLELGIPAAARLVLLYGELSARKGMVALLEALADPTCLCQVHVLMAGRCQEFDLLKKNEAFQRLIAECRIHILQGYIEDEQERQILAAADCTWLGYIGCIGMSGIMVLSGVHGLPVLASPEGIIGYFARKHKIGVIIEPRNRESIIAALNRLVTEPDLYLRAGRNGASAFQAHSLSEVGRIFSEKTIRLWR